MEVERDHSQTVEELIVHIRSQLRATERDLSLGDSHQNLCYDYSLSRLQETKSRVLGYLGDINNILEQSQPFILDPIYRKKLTRAASTSSRAIASVKLKDSIKSCMNMLHEYKGQLKSGAIEKIFNSSTFEKQVRDICTTVGVTFHLEPPKWTFLLEESVVDIYVDHLSGPYQVIHECAISDGMTIEKHLGDLLQLLNAHDMKQFQERVTNLILWERTSLINGTNVPSPVVLESTLQQYVSDLASHMSGVKIRLFRISNGFNLYYHPPATTEHESMDESCYELLEKHYSHKITILFENGAFFLKLSPHVNISLTAIQQHPNVFPPVLNASLRDPLEYLAPKYFKRDLHEKEVEMTDIKLHVREFLFTGPAFHMGSQPYTINKIPFVSIDQIKPFYLILTQTISFERLRSSLADYPADTTDGTYKETFPVEVWLNTPNSIEVSWMDTESARLIGLKFVVGLGGASRVEPLAEEMADSFPGNYLNTILSKSNSVPHVLYYALQKKYCKRRANQDSME